MTEPLWISERDVQLSLADAIKLVRKAVLREAAGNAKNMDKTHVQWTGGDLHAIGAVFTDVGVLGVKCWAHTPRGATPIELLWDADTGALLAVIEAFAMGQLRTAAMAGLATDLLAAPDADVMAICGTGKQALAQVAAVSAVRSIRRVQVFGRDAGRRDALAGRIEHELGIASESFDDVRAAVAGAPVITLITRAAAPFLAADMPERGAHINAMGAITQERREFETALLGRCALVAVDSISQARALASELGGADCPPTLRPIGELIAANRGRPARADLTLFKSLGVGIADLALAEAMHRQAREASLGRPLPRPAPAPLTFTPGQG
ncbi:MAG: ornithine cyclodeaminase family protein [Caulobacteraceae bacterium]